MAGRSSGGWPPRPGDGDRSCTRRQTIAADAARRSARRDALAQQLRCRLQAARARVHAVARHDACRRHSRREVRRHARLAAGGATCARAAQRAAGPPGGHVSPRNRSAARDRRYRERSPCKLDARDHRHVSGRSPPRPAHPGPRYSFSTSTRTLSASAHRRLRTARRPARDHSVWRSSAMASDYAARRSSRRRAMAKRRSTFTTIALIRRPMASGCVGP